MRHFARLLDRLQECRERPEQARHLRRFLDSTTPDDASAALHLLAGGPAGPRLPPALLAASAARAAGLPADLFDACRAATADLAEAIALAVPSPREPVDGSLNDWLHRGLPALHALPTDARVDRLAELWPTLSAGGRRVLAELLQGGLRRPLGSDTLAPLLAHALDLEAGLMGQRLAAFIAAPTCAALAALTAPADPGDPLPEPFAQIVDVDRPPISVADRWIGWCPQGLRAQLVVRGGQAALWSEQRQRLNTRFLDLVEAAEAMLPPDTVLEGWIVAPDASGLGPRLGARPISRAAQARRPMRFVALDAPWWAGQPQQQHPLPARLALLARQLGGNDVITAATALTVPDIDSLLRHHTDGRRQRVAGLVWAEPGTTGHWRRWPLPPLTARVVLVYAQAGPRGYEHFSFAVHDQEGFATVIKLPAEAAGEWAAQLTDTVRDNAVRRTGPIHEVAPQRVYELAFDALDESPRHKCGLLLRGARLLGPRDDLPLQDADTLDRLRGLLHGA